MLRTDNGGEGRRWEGEERKGGQMGRTEEREEKMRREKIEMDSVRWRWRKRRKTQTRES